MFGVDVTKGDLNGFIFLGRPIKPVAFGMSILMMTLTFINVFDVGLFGNSLLGDVVAVLSFGSFVLLILGWFGNLQPLVEYGLLIASAVYVIRGSFVMLTFGLSNEGVWQSFGTAVIAGGAYLLERLDSHPRRTVTPSVGILYEERIDS